MRLSSGSGGGKPNWLSRVVWLIALWGGGVAGLGAAAWLLRGVMRAVGFV